MTQSPPLMDEDLTAFLDGEASPELSTRIEAELAQSTALQDRLALLDAGMAGLREDWARVMDLAPVTPDVEGAVAAATGPGVAPGRFWSGAAMGAMAAAVAAAALWFVVAAPQGPAVHPGGVDVAAADPMIEAWHHEVAAYHALYTEQTLAAETTSAARAAQLETLSQVIGRDLTVLPDVAPLTYRRAQPLGFKGKPLIQIAFLAEGGIPMALCIVQNGRGADALRSTEIQGMAATAWADENHRFLLIGGTDPEVITKAAEAFAATL